MSGFCAALVAVLKVPGVTEKLRSTFETWSRDMFLAGKDIHRGDGRERKLGRAKETAGYNLRGR